MYHFSKRSLENLGTCKEPIRRVMTRAIVDYDFTVICGFRNEAEQNEAYRSGFSKLEFPKSRHNKWKSGAIDIAPYPIDWDDLDRFVELSIIIKYHAGKEAVLLDWGFDLWGWDYPHWQLREV